MKCNCGNSCIYRVVEWNLYPDELARGLNPVDAYCKVCWLDAFDGSGDIEADGLGRILYRREDEEGETDDEEVSDTETEEL